MNEDHSELISFLDGKFNELSDKFETLRQDFNILQTSVDAYAKKADTYFQEMVMLSHKVDRHEKWLQLLAEKVGVKLTY